MYCLVGDYPATHSWVILQQAGKTKTRTSSGVLDPPAANNRKPSRSLGALGARRIITSWSGAAVGNHGATVGRGFFWFQLLPDLATGRRALRVSP